LVEVACKPVAVEAPNVHDVIHTRVGDHDEEFLEPNLRDTGLLGPVGRAG
jgi:hypothetical protein